MVNLKFLNKKKIYENRLGKFYEDIRPMFYWCQIFYYFPIQIVKLTNNNYAFKLNYFITFVCSVIRFVFLITVLIMSIFGNISSLNDIGKKIVIRNLYFIFLLTFDLIFNILRNHENLIIVLKLIHNFDLHLTILQTKNEFKKLKYHRYFLIIVFSALLPLLIFIEINNLRHMKSIYLLNILRSLLALIIFYDYITKISLIIILHNEIYLRKNILKMSFSNIFSEIVISKVDTNLINLNFDKYRDLHKKLILIINKLNNYFKIDLVIIYNWSFVISIYLLFISDYANEVVILITMSSTLVGVMLLNHSASLLNYESVSSTIFTFRPFISV